MQYVFCPSEPELRIVVEGKMERFHNGKLVYEDGDPRAEWFRREILSRPPGSPSRFVISDTLEDANLVRVLTDRTGRAMAQRANAQNPATIQQDVELQLNVMLAREGALTESALSPEDIIRMLAENAGNRMASRPEFAKAPEAQPGLHGADEGAQRAEENDVIAESVRRAGGPEALDNLEPPTVAPVDTKEDQTGDQVPAGAGSEGSPLFAPGVTIPKTEQSGGDPDIFGVQ